MCRTPGRECETATHRDIIYRHLPGSKANAWRLAGQAGACRFVWGSTMGQHNDAHEDAKANGEKPPSVSFFSLGSRLVYSVPVPLDGYSANSATYWLGLICGVTTQRTVLLFAESGRVCDGTLALGSSFPEN